MRPDRIIVGECRGAEALDMLQAMNTGVEGSMTNASAPRHSPTMMRSGRMRSAVRSNTRWFDAALFG